MKIFKEEIQKLFNRLKSKTSFSFSKYADGEWMAMNQIPVFNGEFRSDTSEKSLKSIQLLRKSFRYRHPDYYVGISCPCCQGQSHYDMKMASGQDEVNLTFANIFVNSNYEFYKSNFIPEYKNWSVNLIANEKSDISKLPFTVKRFYPIKVNAWVENLELIDELKKLNTKNELYLFSAGPFGNILAHQLWDNNNENTYIDIGSTLNPWLGFEGFKRGYLYGSDDLNKICIWNQ
jgi:hypothetical protein